MADFSTQSGGSRDVPQGTPVSARMDACRWVVAASLAVIAVCLAVAVLGPLAGPRAIAAPADTAAACNCPPAAGGKLLAVAGQIANDTYGIYLLDRESSTMSMYQWLPAEHKLKLVAARNFAFDLQLGDYNTLPSPREIKSLVEQHRPTAATQP